MLPPALHSCSSMHNQQLLYLYGLEHIFKHQFYMLNNPLPHKLKKKSYFICKLFFKMSKYRILVSYFVPPKTNSF